MKRVIPGADGVGLVRQRIAMVFAATVALLHKVRDLVGEQCISLIAYLPGAK
jgi:hypothetical protein